MIWEEVESSQFKCTLVFNFKTKPFRPHTQSETGVTWPSCHRSVSPLARSLNVAVETNTAADYHCFSRWKEAKVAATKQAQGQFSQKEKALSHLFTHELVPLTLCTEHGWLKALVQKGRLVKTQTAATPKCPGQAGQATNCGWKQPDEGRCRSCICTLQTRWRVTLQSSKSVTSNSLSRFM